MKVLSIRKAHGVAVWKGVLLGLVLVLISGQMLYHRAPAAEEPSPSLSILLTNDDGIDAPGIIALQRELAAIGQVTVVAPKEDRSGVGHALTFFPPMKLKRVEREGKFFGYALSGTPADCVKLALSKLLQNKPDLVISGINRGANVGIAVFSSGTVAGAREGAIQGISAIALSLASHRGAPDQDDYRFAARFTRKLALLVAKNGLPPGVLLNVNVPAGEENEIKGVAVTRQETGKLDLTFQEAKDPFGELYYYYGLGPRSTRVPPDGQTDQGALAEGRVSITPLRLDTTEDAWMEKLRGWNFQ